MGKQHDKHPFADNPFLEGLAGWMDSPAGELSTVVLDAVWALLEKVEVDAKQRKIIWEDGQRLSITESVHRIHAGCPDFPLELIETHLLGWLEMDFVPPPLLRRNCTSSIGSPRAGSRTTSGEPRPRENVGELGTLEWL